MLAELTEPLRLARRHCCSGGLRARRRRPHDYASVVQASPSSSAGVRRDVASTALSATQVYERDSKGVVSIKGGHLEGEDEGRQRGPDPTNDHVVKGATSITIDASGSSNTTLGATLVGKEANKDLALIHVDPSGLGLKATLASSSSVHVGDTVYAIGTPYGLEETFTKGIVSALDREISAPDGSKIARPAAVDTLAADSQGD